ncbi:TolC family protein [Stieleria sp. JC731]|uniref:TolC family protein n=1 Tax=Pirellulaceae TaxID=2691357 RepID=UPI001E34DF68|nr:TolC family protein [Stieleria sp. JC731]MCC9603988.1 TolC family protein [Stieleria sp. JC731]
MGKSIVKIGCLGLAGVFSVGCTASRSTLPAEAPGLAIEAASPAETPVVQSSDLQVDKVKAAAAESKATPALAVTAWEVAEPNSVDDALAFSADHPKSQSRLAELLIDEAEAGDEDMTVRQLVNLGNEITDDVAGESNSGLDNDWDSDGKLSLNLPSALAMVSAGHPVVGHARWRVQHAYAQLEQTQVLWLPSIQAGFSFHRHDGNYQASDGNIVDVNRNSFQYGLGNRATGAGTTPNPGVVAQFHLADAVFLPRVAEKNAWAQGHAAGAALNQTLRDVAVAYINLLEAQQRVAIWNACVDRTQKLAKLTADYAEAGEGLRADADRLETELALVNSRLAEADQFVAMKSAELTRAISLEDTRLVHAVDVGMIPLDLNQLDDVSKMSAAEKSSMQGMMVATGLSRRPELKESSALVAAACEAYRREKYAPLVPSVLLGFSTGSFGGGLGADPENFDSRYDFDAAMTWQLRNLGFGDRAARRVRSAEIQQAKYERLRRMDQVAEQVSQAYWQVIQTKARIESTQIAIKSASQSYERNLSRIRDGEGLPLEVLQSNEAFQKANEAYLQAVADHNRAQVQLQWAQGWPVSSGVIGNPETN